MLEPIDAAQTFPSEHEPSFSLALHHLPFLLAGIFVISQLAAVMVLVSRCSPGLHGL